MKARKYTEEQIIALLREAEAGARVAGHVEVSFNGR